VDLRIFRLYDGSFKGNQKRLDFSNYQLNAQFFYFSTIYEGWNFNSGNYLFTTDTK